MDLSHLKALIALLRTSGVTRYQTPELTLELAPAAPKARRRRPSADATSPAASDSPDASPLTDEDILFYSATPS